MFDKIVNYLLLFVTNCEIYIKSYKLNKLVLKIQKYKELGRTAEMTDLMTEQYMRNKDLFLTYGVRRRILEKVSD